MLFRSGYAEGLDEGAFIHNSIITKLAIEIVASSKDKAITPEDYIVIVATGKDITITPEGNAVRLTTGDHVLLTPNISLGKANF